MKTLIRAAFAIVSLGITVANGQSAHYHTPASNYYQNNWMGD
jgi:hypothetical protein